MSLKLSFLEEESWKRRLHTENSLRTPPDTVGPSVIGPKHVVAMLDPCQSQKNSKVSHPRPFSVALLDSCVFSNAAFNMTS